MMNLTILNHWYIPWISHPSAMVTMALWHPRLWRPEPGRCARRSGGHGEDGDHQRSGEGLGQAAPWMIHDDPLEELGMLVGQVGEQWHHDNLDLWWFILMLRHFLYDHLWFMLMYVTLNVGFQGSLQQKKSKEEDVPGKQGIVWFNCHAVECDTWSAQANHLWVCLRISPRPSLLGTIVYESWELLECVGPGVYSTD